MPRCLSRNEGVPLQNKIILVFEKLNLTEQPAAWVLVINLGTDDDFVATRHRIPQELLVELPLIC